MNMNINDTVKVRLTEKGKQILKEKVDQDLAIIAKYGIDINSYLDNFAEDVYGYYEFQIWELMEIFGGSHMGITKEQVFVDNNIEVVEKIGVNEKSPKGESLKFLKEELIHARTKFPGNEDLTVALMEEVGELAQATLKCDTDNLKKEALQVACVAMRIYEEGDATFNKRVGISQDEKELKLIDASLIKCEYDKNKDLYRFEFVNKYKDKFTAEISKKPTKQQLRKFVEDGRSKDGWLVKNKEDLQIASKEYKEFERIIKNTGLGFDLITYSHDDGYSFYICDLQDDYKLTISRKPSSDEIIDVLRNIAYSGAFYDNLGNRKDVIYCFKDWKVIRFNGS